MFSGQTRFGSFVHIVVLFSGIAQGVQRSVTGLAMILGPLWGGALTRRLYLMLGVMAALEVILAVSTIWKIFAQCFNSFVLFIAIILVVTQRFSSVSEKECCVTL